MSLLLSSAERKINTASTHVATLILSIDVRWVLVTTAWRDLRLRMEETPFGYGE
jgi:hypothetical protein